MSGGAKFVFFLVALCIMACFAVGSVMMAQDRPGWAVLLFVIAVLAAGLGFVMKRRVMKR